MAKHNMSTGPFQLVSCQPVTSGEQSRSEEGTKAGPQPCEAYEEEQGDLGLERSRCLYFQASKRLFCGRESRWVWQEPRGRVED